MAETAGTREVVIEVRGLKEPVRFPGGARKSRPRRLSGEVIGIVGGQGTGKSVLLRSIVGLNRPSAGSVKVFGQDLRSLPDDRRREVETRWGVLFRRARCSGLTVAQERQVPMRASPSAAGADGPARGGQDRPCRPSAGCGREVPVAAFGRHEEARGLARALALDPRSSSSTSRPPPDPIGVGLHQLILRLKGTR